MWKEEVNASVRSFIDESQIQTNKEVQKCYNLIFKFIIGDRGNRQTKSDF